MDGAAKYYISAYPILAYNNRRHFIFEVDAKI